MLYRNGYNKYYIILPKKISKNVFIDKCKVNAGTYAFEFASRMYNCLTSNMINHNLEYEKYYKEEYDTVCEYFNNELRIDDLVKKDLSMKFNPDEHYLCTITLSDNGDYNMSQFIGSDLGIKIVENILKGI